MKKIKINNLNWKVKFVETNNAKLEQEPDEQVVCGITQFSELTIYINKDIDMDLLLPTIIHELTHAYLFSYGLDQFENYNEENICDIMASYGKDILYNADLIYENYIDNLTLCLTK